MEVMPWEKAFYLWDNHYDVQKKAIVTTIGSLCHLDAANIRKIVVKFCVMGGTLMCVYGNLVDGISNGMSLFQLRW